MARLGIHKDFLWEFGRLERSVQDLVYEAFAKFDEATYAGAHLEKIAGARDGRLRTIRIDRFWRGVVLAPESGDSYTLLTVRPHDDAYAWARRRRVSVNAATGAVEVRDVAAIEERLPELAERAAATPARLFADVSDADLARLGVDEQTRAFARTLTDVEQLEAARALLPEPQYDALIGLAVGMTPEQVWAELVGADAEPAAYDPDDVTAAVERSTDRVVLVSGPEELMEVFSYPFALWRVYLHPSQRRVAYGSYAGPARVTGGPGTGKTVVALHRARHLAESSPEDGSVLLTTFTKTLAGSLDEGLALLVDDERLRRRVDVRHIDQLAYKVVSDRHGRLPVLRHDDERDRWAGVVKRLGLPFSETFLAQEWRQVVLAQGITSLEGYLAARRSGRGRPLSARQREQVWQAITELTRGLADDRLWTYETICVEATRLLEEAERKPYRHIVVDEAQDLSPVQWRLLRAAVEPGPDDIFIAGDTHQRIYDNRVSLRQVGIEVAGRSERLRINYRTTAEILGWSLGLLRGERIDDMDDGLEDLAGCRSQVHGEPPRLHGAPTRMAELEHLVAAVRGWLDQGVEAGQIGVAARSNMLVDEAVAALSRAGVPVVSLARKPADDATVAVGTMHRMKGLEFRCVAVIGVSEHAVPSPSAVTPAEEDELAHAQDLQRERCLLFVACTRAREELLVSWHGAPSPLLDFTQLLTAS